MKIGIKPTVGGSSGTSASCTLDRDVKDFAVLSLAYKVPLAYSLDLT